jgi:hypothetical protein
MLLNLVKTFETPAGFSDFVGSNARVRKAGTQDPVRLYTAAGALLSDNGRIALGSDGLLDAWVAPGYLYDLDLVNPRGAVSATFQAVDPAVPEQEVVEPPVLGTMATQNADNVVITNGQVTAAAIKAISLVDKTGSDDSPFLVSSSDATNPLQLMFGFKPQLTTVQSIEQGVAFRPLALNPFDGRVLVGKEADDGVNLLQVDGSIKAAGPFTPGEFTLATLPAAATTPGGYITVTDATGGPKLCRSNGSVWQIANTTTTVS